MLSPSASYSAGQRWFAPDQAAREHARALQHPETDFDPETGAVELHSALSSLNEATFEDGAGPPASRICMIWEIKKVPGPW